MTNFNTTHIIPEAFSGSKSSGGKSGSSSGVEAPNTLRSNSIARVIMAVSEGEIGGLSNRANVLNSVYLDETPVVSDNGQPSFKGIVVTERFGMPDQTPVPNFTETENTISIGVELRKQTLAETPSPGIIRQVSNQQIDAVKIVMTLPGLQIVDKKTGDINGTTVQFQFAVQDATVGVWEDRGVQTVTGKCASPYQIAYRLPRPAGNDKWSWRVTRITDDSKLQELQNQTTVASSVEIISSTQSYPNTAYIAIEIDTDQFGNNVPNMSFKVDGVKVPVPTNYNQSNIGVRGGNVYNGMWDGGFKYESTNNPAWNFLEVITNPRWGLGLESIYIDRFKLYELARYCDAVDTNGNFQGVTDREGGYRPRYTIQTQVNTQEDAMAFIQAFVSSMRAMAHFGAGVIQITADKPRTPVKLFGPENVVDGKFVYSSTEMKDRYTEANVTYNDPKDFFRPDVISYKSPVAAARYPRNVIDIVKFGCANKFEAFEYGKWVVDTSITQTNMVSFKAGPEAAVLRPGDVFEVADPRRQGGKLSGRIQAGSTQTHVVLDAPVTMTAGKNYTLKVVAQDGQSSMSAPISSDSITGSAVSQINLMTPLPQTPTVPHMWIIAGDDIVPTTYTCITLKEDTDLSYDVTGMFYDPNKYLRVEDDIVIDDSPYNRIDLRTVLPPTNIRFGVTQINDPILGPRNRLNVAWDASASPYVQDYEVYHRVATGDVTAVDAQGKPLQIGQYVLVGHTPTNDIDIPNIVPGIHEVLVKAINLAGRESIPANGTYTFQYGGTSSLQPPIHLRVKNTESFEFFAPDCVVTWQDNPANAGITSAKLAGWRIRILTPDVNKQEIAVYYQMTPTITEFTYAHATNNANGLRRGFGVEVCAVDGTSAVSAPLVETIFNAAPVIPNNVKFIPFYTAYRLVHDQPVEQDAVGTLVWASKEQGFIPSASNLVHEGTGTYHDVEADEDTTYYVRFAVYDTFSRDPSQLNVSTEYTVRTVSDLTVFPPPKTPDGITLTSSSTQGVVWLDIYWNPLPPGSFTSYEVSVSEGSDQFWIGGIQTGLNTHRMAVKGSTLYFVRVRASNGTKLSNYALKASITTVDTTGFPAAPPGDPSDLKVTRGFNSLWLEWKIDETKGPTNFTEVYESDSNFRPATPVGQVQATNFSRGGLGTGVTKYYWLRQVGAGGAGNYFPANPQGGLFAQTRSIETADYAELSIVNAFIADATIDDAKIFSLDASKIKANTVIAGNVVLGGSGEYIDGIVAKANNPVYQVNQGTTLIQPGKIELSGGTSLSSWLNGGDNTQIEGGKIAANTIKANSIEIGARNVSIQDIAFEPDKSSGVVSWSAGSITYVGPNGPVTTQIPGSSTYGLLASQANPVYIYWPKDSGYLLKTDDNFVAHAANNIVLATYTGGINVIANFGGTIIDGDQIISGTIRANRIEAHSLGAQQINADEAFVRSATIQTGAIQTAHIMDAAITSAQILDGSIQTAKLYDATITTAKIANAAITTAKIADAQIVNAHIQNGSISSANIQDAAILRAKIGDLQVDTIKVAGGSISSITGANSSGSSVYVTVNVRDISKPVVIMGYYQGDATYYEAKPGQYNTGILEIRAEGNGQNYGRIGGVINNFDAYILPVSEKLMIATHVTNVWSFWQPPSPGVYNFIVATATTPWSPNVVGILVMELAR